MAETKTVPVVQLRPGQQVLWNRRVWSVQGSIATSAANWALTLRHEDGSEQFLVGSRSRTFQLVTSQ